MEDVAAAAAAAATGDDDSAYAPWTDLPTDLLREISGYLREAGDFVRFHATCKSWREAAPAGPPRFLPWIVGQLGIYLSDLSFHSPFSGTTWNVPNNKAPELRGYIGLACSDGTGGRLLTQSAFGENAHRFLVNPLSGHTTTLPPLPPEMYGNGRHLQRRIRSFVSDADGAVVSHSDESCRLAAVFPPGATEWDMVTPPWIWYHDHVKVPRASDPAEEEASRFWVDLPPLPAASDGRRHVFESRGELLCAVAVERPSPSVSVYALFVTGGPEEPQWLEKNYKSFPGGDRVCLFLAGGSSFVVDAGEYAGEEVAGGSAYFVVHGVCVYRYSFMDGTATMVRRLPAPDTSGNGFLWLVPNPELPWN